jgi:hypothetical protein
MPTPRHNLPLSNDYPMVMDTADALYEIADAELASRFDIHLLWASLKQKHKEFRKTFAREISSKVMKIALDNGLLFVSQHMAAVVSERIAQDWWEHDQGCQGS